MATSDERFYKRKLNEFDQELKRLQRELAKLKVLRREGGRARKQLLRSMQREAELQEIVEMEQAERLKDLAVRDEKDDKPCCKKCNSKSVNSLQAGNRTVIICKECESRYTIINEIAETA